MKRLIHLLLMPGISLAILLTSTITVEAQGPPPPPSGETNENSCLAWVLHTEPASTNSPRSPVCKVGLRV